MNTKYFFLGAIAILIGFLFYPRNAKTIQNGDRQIISPQRRLDDEPLRTTDLLRSDPPFATYDLGYVYQIDKIDVTFDDPEGSAPKQFDILVQTENTNSRYDRVFSYVGTSREYNYSLHSFQFPVEARRLQIVINDWFSNRPKLKKDQTRVGLRYRSHNPIQSVTANFNKTELTNVINLITFDNSKWIAAKRIETENDSKIEVNYESPQTDPIITFDLGAIQKIYGTRLTTDGPGNNVKSYRLFAGTKDRDLNPIHQSDQLADETLEVIEIFDPPLIARYVQLQINDRYGDYAELREFEIFTDNYRYFPIDLPLDDFRAIQMQYESLGEAGNRNAPHLTQGFPFDRDTDDENRYFLIEGDADENVDPNNTPAQKSFAYHYDTVKMRYDRLKPWKFYWVQIDYLQEKGGDRVQNLIADGFILHSAKTIPKGKAETLIFPIPPPAFADGEIELNFNRLNGANAVVSEIAFFEASPQTEAQSADPEISAGRAIQFNDEIQIDGNLTEWHKLYPISENPITLFSQWNSENLYFLAEVDLAELPKTDLQTLDLFIDTQKNRSPGMFTTSDHHFLFSIFKPFSDQPIVRPSQIHHHQDAIAKNIPFHSEIDVAIKKKKNNESYKIEIRLPKNAVLSEFDPKIGTEIGLNFILSSDDLRFAHATPDANAAPNQWRTLELVSEIGGEVIFMNADATAQISDFIAGDAISLCVWDADRNRNRSEIESIEVQLRSETETISIILHEMEFSKFSSVKIENISDAHTKNSSLFATKIRTQFRENEIESEKLSVRGGETVQLSYVDPYFSQTESDKKITAEITTRIGNDGIFDVSDLLKCNDDFVIKLSDDDLPIDQPISVKIQTDTSAEIETLDLNFDAEKNAFFGRIPTIYSETATPSDGTLQIIGQQQITAIYLDQLRSSGQPNLEMTETINVAIGDTARFTLTPSHQIRSDSALAIKLTDTDLNLQNDQIEKIKISISGDQLNDQLAVDLSEISENSGTFVGVCQTQFSASAIENDRLEVIGDEKITLRYLDDLQGSGETKVEVIAEISVASGTDGVIEIIGPDRQKQIESFNAGDLIRFRLRDRDVVNDVSEIEISASQTNDIEKVILSGTNTDGVFNGWIETEYQIDPTPNDDRLQVRGGEKIVVKYLDRLRSNGETDVEMIANCGVNVGNSGEMRAFLEANFNPESRQNKEISRFRAGDTLILEIEDPDLNTTSAVAQLFETDLTENSVRDSIGISMREVGGNAGVFRGRIRTGYGEMPIANDGILQVHGGGVVSFVYTDAIQTTGATNVKIQLDLAVEIGTSGDLEIYRGETDRLISGSRIGVGSFSVGERLRIQLIDRDLNLFDDQIETVKVEIFGNVNREKREIELREIDRDDTIFIAEIQTTDQKNPNQFFVSEKEVITIRYLDAITATGETSVIAETQAIVLGSDSGLLKIADANGAELPNFNAGQMIFLHLNDLLLTTVINAEQISIEVRGDQTGDFVNVDLDRSSDDGVFVGSLPTRFGKTAIADDTLDVQGDEQITAIYSPSFRRINTTTVQDSTHVNSGTIGSLSVTRKDGSILENFNVGSTIFFRLEDADLNTDALTQESTQIRFRRDGIAETVTATLIEENRNSAIFRGEIETIYGGGENGKLGLIGGETVSAIYDDAVIETGETNVEVVLICRANQIAWAKRATDYVAIDGLDDKWHLENVCITPKNEALLWLQWDEEAIYFLAQIYDDSVEVPDPTRYYQSADAIELHFDLDPTDSGKPIYLQNETDPDRYIFWLCPKGGGFDGNRPYFGQAAPKLIPNYEAKGVKIATSIKDDYYLIEARIPFFPILRGFDPIKTKRHRKIGFNFVVHRSSEQAVRWATPLPGSEIYFPSDLGLLIIEND